MNTIQKKITTAIQQAKNELDKNPRLRFGLIGIVCIAIVAGLLHLNDEKTQALKRLQKLQIETRKNDLKLGDLSRTNTLKSQLNSANTYIEEQLWHFNSPVIAQTEWLDWLNNEFQEQNIATPLISQPIYSIYSLDKENNTTSESECTKSTCNLIELRSTVRFNFAGDNLFKLIARLESSEKNTRIEKLNFNAATKTAELTVVSLAQISEDAKAPVPLSKISSELAKAASAAAEIQTNNSKTASNASVASKVVEIKW